MGDTNIENLINWINSYCESRKITQVDGYKRHVAFYTLEQDPCTIKLESYKNLSMVCFDPVGDSIKYLKDYLDKYPTERTTLIWRLRPEMENDLIGDNDIKNRIRFRFAAVVDCGSVITHMVDICDFDQWKPHPWNYEDHPPKEVASA